MGFLDFFKKKAPEMQHAWEHHYTLADYRNLVDELAGFFRTRKEVKEACMGYLINAESKEKKLFLGVKHDGGLKEIGEKTLNLKTIFLGKMEMGFISTEEDEPRYEMLLRDNFPFYTLAGPNEVEFSLLKSHFDRQFLDELKEKVKHSKMGTLVKKFAPGETSITFQTLVRDDKEFVPFFTRPEMIALGGMIPIPEGLRTIEIDWEKVFGEGAPAPMIVINPGTDFEAEVLFS